MSNETSGTPTQIWTAIRDDLRAKRAMRAQVRAMERDLDGCTAAQYSELQAIVSRYDGPDAEAVRTLINRRIA